MYMGWVFYFSNMFVGVCVVVFFVVGIKNSEMWIDEDGNQFYFVLEVLSVVDLKVIIEEYVMVVKNVIVVGFDGVELYVVNGYLLE